MAGPVYITNSWAVDPRGIKTQPLQFCHWAAPMYGDAGQSMLNTVLAVVAFIVAYKSLEAQIEINDMRRDIADGYAKITEDRWRRFKSAYAPLELALINEIMSQGPVEPDYERARSNHNAYVANAFGDAQARLAGLAQRYALCIDETLTNDLQLSAGLAADDGVNFGYRWEEWYAIMRDDIRWNRRSNLLNLGRDLLAQSAQYASYANNILAGLGEQAGKAFSGALGYLGYYFSRQNTAYPNSYVSSSTPGGVLDFGGMRGVGDMGGVSLGGVQAGQF